MRQIGVGGFKTTPRMRELVNEVLDSGRLSYGPKSRAFETWLAQIHNCQFGVLSNSGTSSLQVALQALKEMHGWADGTEVIVPASTFVADINIVLHNRMKPVLVDIDPHTYNMDTTLLPGIYAKRRNVKCIIPVHLYGQAVNMTELRVTTDVSGWSIIEDACESLFATHYDKPVGSMSDIGCFSTYVAHLVTTGVGGLAITDNPDLAVKMRSLVNHGRDGIYLSIDDDKNVSNLTEVVERRFRFESVGHSYRITELEAAVGLAQLEDWETMIARRNANAAYLSAGLMGLEDRLQLPTIAPGNTHSFMMYPIVTCTEDKWGLVNYLELSGIETREMMPITNQPVYRGMFDPNDYPVADRINRHGFYIGPHQHLTQEDLDYILEIIYGYYA